MKIPADQAEAMDVDNGRDEDQETPSLKHQDTVSDLSSGVAELECQKDALFLSDRQSSEQQVSVLSPVSKDQVCFKKPLNVHSCSSQNKSSPQESSESDLIETQPKEGILPSCETVIVTGGPRLQRPSSPLQSSSQSLMKDIQLEYDWCCQQQTNSSKKNEVQPVPQSHSVLHVLKEERIPVEKLLEVICGPETSDSTVRQTVKHSENFTHEPAQQTHEVVLSGHQKCKRSLLEVSNQHSPPFERSKDHLSSQEQQVQPAQPMDSHSQSSLPHTLCILGNEQPAALAASTSIPPHSQHSPPHSQHSPPHSQHSPPIAAVSTYAPTIAAVGTSIPIHSQQSSMITTISTSIPRPSKRPSRDELHKEFDSADHSSTCLEPWDPRFLFSPKKKRCIAPVKKRVVGSLSYGQIPPRKHDAPEEKVPESGDGTLVKKDVPLTVGSENHIVPVAVNSDSKRGLIRGPENNRHGRLFPSLTQEGGIDENDIPIQVGSTSMVKTGKLFSPLLSRNSPSVVHSREGSPPADNDRASEMSVLPTSERSFDIVHKKSRLSGAGLEVDREAGHDLTIKHNHLHRNDSRLRNNFLQGKFDSSDLEGNLGDPQEDESEQRNEYGERCLLQGGPRLGENTKLQLNVNSHPPVKGKVDNDQGRYETSELSNETLKKNNQYNGHTSLGYSQHLQRKTEGANNLLRAMLQSNSPAEVYLNISREKCSLSAAEIDSAASITYKKADSSILQAQTAEPLKDTRQQSDEEYNIEKQQDTKSKAKSDITSEDLDKIFLPYCPETESQKALKAWYPFYHEGLFEPEQSNLSAHLEAVRLGTENCLNYVKQKINPKFCPRSGEPPSTVEIPGTARTCTITLSPPPGLQPQVEGVIPVKITTASRQCVTFHVPVSKEQSVDESSQANHYERTANVAQSLSKKARLEKDGAGSKILTRLLTGSQTTASVQTGNNEPNRVNPIASLLQGREPKGKMDCVPMTSEDVNHVRCKTDSDHVGDLDEHAESSYSADNKADWALDAKYGRFVFYWSVYKDNIVHELDRLSVVLDLPKTTLQAWYYIQKLLTGGLETNEKQKQDSSSEQALDLSRSTPTPTSLSPQMSSPLKLSDEENLEWSDGNSDLWYEDSSDAGDDQADMEITSMQRMKYLEVKFAENPRPTEEDMTKFASTLYQSLEMVRNWFTNKRRQVMPEGEKNRNHDKKTPEIKVSLEDKLMARKLDFRYQNRRQEMLSLKKEQLMLEQQTLREQLQIEREQMERKEIEEEEERQLQEAIKLSLLHV